MSREEQLIFIGMEYEKKLKKLMGEEEFEKFSIDVARRGFLKEIVGMEDGDYKDFCIKNFARVVGLKEDEIPKAERSKTDADRNRDS